MKEFFLKNGVKAWAGTADDAHELKNGEVISKDDAILLTYEATIDRDQLLAIIAGMKGDPVNGGAYTVPLPTAIKFPAGSSQSKPLEVNIPAANGQPAERLKFGTLVIDADTGTARVEFLPLSTKHPADPRSVLQYIADEAGGIDECVLYMDCQADDSGIGDKETLNIKLEDFLDVTVTIKEHIKTDPKLEKTGTYDSASGKVSWTVTYTPGTKTFSTPLSFVDTFSSADQTYVDGSFGITEGGTFESSLFTEATAGGSTALTYSPLPPATNPPVPMVFTYQTVLSDEKVKASAGTEITLGNKAAVRDSTGKELVSATEKTPVKVAKEDTTWLVKDFETDFSGAPKSIVWKLTVNTVGRNLKDLTLYDQFPTDHLTLDTNSFEVQDADGNWQSIASAGITVNATPGKHGERDYQFSLAFGTPPQQSDYQLRYRTDVDSLIFENSQPLKATNEAWLDFSWLKYNGTDPVDFDYTLPGVKKEAAPPTSMIDKKSTSYNRETHEITWQVTVNPHLVDYQSGTITDNLDQFAGSEQTYVADSFLVTAGDSSQITMTGADTSQKNLAFTVGALGTAALTYEFKTTLDKADDYGTNHGGKSYKNKVEMDAMVVSYADAIHSSAEGSCWMTSNVVQKGGTGYDYKTGRLSWQVTVNGNKMPMTAPVLKDVLEEGQSYVDGSVTVTDGELADSNPVTYDAATRTLTVSLKDIPQGKSPAVRFQTLLNPDDMGEAFRKGTDVKVNNAVTLSHAGFSDSTSNKAVQTVKNPVLTKSSISVDNNDEFIDFLVNINPNRITLSGKNQTLVDSLPQGLLLDLSSVKLYSAEVTATGGFPAKPVEANELPKEQYQIAYDAAKRILTVTLPQGSGSYQLAYRTDVFDASKAPFQNDIRFADGSSMESETGSSTSVRFSGSGGGGLSRRKAGLQIIKQDSAKDADGNNRVLAGVGFELYNQKDLTTVLDYGETDANGLLTFYALDPTSTFVVKERGTPEGYLPLEEGITATFTHTGEKQTFTLVNERVSADVVLQKNSDATETGLAGVTFTLTNKTGTNPFTLTAVSDKTGKVLFADVPFGEYGVTEAQAPEYYRPFTKDISVTVSKTDGETPLILIGGQVGATVLNEHQRGSVQIVKTEKNSTKPMENVEFTLLEKISGKTVASAKTDKDGLLTFENLLVGTVYLLRETVPQGYLPVEDKELTLTQDNQLKTVNWENTKIPIGSIAIHKTDSATGKAMEGVEFQLLSSDKTLLTSGKTDSEGKLAFTNLPAITTYFLREITPVGYRPSEDRSVAMSEGKEYGIDWKNDPISRGSVAIRKTDSSSGKAMEGVEFQLLSKDGTLLSKGSTDKDGALLFGDLLPGTYTLHEIVPEGYEPCADKTVELREGETQTLDWKNTPKPIGSITVTIVDSKTKKPIVDVEFKLLDKDGNVVQVGRTDKDGKLTFINIPGDQTYTIRPASPEGYKHIGDITVQVKGSEAKEVPVKADPISPTPTPTVKPTVKPTPTPKPKLPQTGSNQLVPLLVLGAGALLTAVGCTGYFGTKGRRNKGNPDKK